MCTFLLLNRMQPIKISMNLWHLFPFSIFSFLSHFSGLIFTCKAFNISQQKTVFCSKYNTIYNLLYHNSCFSLFLLKYTEKTEKCLWEGKKFNLWRCLRTNCSSELSKEYLWDFFLLTRREAERNNTKYIYLLFIYTCVPNTTYI